MNSPVLTTDRDILCRRRSDGALALASKTSYGDRARLTPLLLSADILKAVESGLTIDACNSSTVSSAAFARDWDTAPVPSEDRLAAALRCLDEALPRAREKDACAKPDQYGMTDSAVQHLTWMVVEQTLEMQLADGALPVERWNGYFHDGEDRAHGFDAIAGVMYFDLTIMTRSTDVEGRTRQIVDWATAPTADKWAALWPSLSEFLCRTADHVSGFNPCFSVSPDDGRSIRFTSPPIPWRAWSKELATEFTIPIPCGTLLVSNDLRAFFPDTERFFDNTPEALPEDYLQHPLAKKRLPVITVNNPIGLRASSLLAARQGRGEFFTGDCGADWFVHKPTGTILALIGGLGDDQPEPDFHPLGDIESDLWWAHFADRDLAASREPYALWDSEERTRCNVSNCSSYADWRRDHAAFEVDLGGKNSVRVRCNGAHDIAWTEPGTGRVLQAFAILEPVRI